MRGHARFRWTSCGGVVRSRQFGFELSVSWLSLLRHLRVIRARHYVSDAPGSGQPSAESVSAAASFRVQLERLKQ